MIKQYVLTHLHTAEGSVGDAIITNKELIKKIKKLDMKSVCITDHGSLSNMYGFYYSCIEAGIKPIIGCEVYLTKDRIIKDKKNEDSKEYHLILIAKNNIGVKNLLKILSDGGTIGYFKGKSRTDLKYIKEHKEGLICTTACVGGYAPSLIIQGKNDEAEKHILELKEVFHDDLYLEIQPGNFVEQYIVNQQMIMFHEKHSIKLIASNDVHYINKEDWGKHDAHVKDNRRKNNKEITIESPPIYPDKCYYIMTYDELLNSFDKDFNKNIIKEAINNTNKLASKCFIEFNETKLNMPEFECPSGYIPKDYIEHLCFKRLNEIEDKVKNPSKYVNRIYEELKVIHELGFTSYFLIIKDIIDFAKNNNIPVGPGRGSVAGSLVAYLLGITKVDPVKYDLMFERFLSIHRKGSIPDIDTDFGNGRDKIFEYVKNKYGKNRCAIVSTLEYRKNKNAVRTAGRLIGIEPKTINIISSLINNSFDTIEESILCDNKLQEYQKQYPNLFKIAEDIKGYPSNCSTHAAGVLITDTNIIDVAPVIKQNDKILNSTTLNLESAESQMLVKYDFLGLNSLDIVKECEKITGYKFDAEFNEYNDEKVWDLISSKFTTGLFQIGSDLYKSRIDKINPRNLDELANCIALIRGPCISNRLDKKYISILQGKEEIELIHPTYDEVTKDTCGILIYQEQLMKCCFNMGLPLYEGYILMKASSKKKFEKIDEYKTKLWDLVKNNMPKDTFEKIFKIIHDTGKYSFNKSHAIAYSILCYITAYYKCYYPEAFMAACFNNVYINKGKSKEDKSKILKDFTRECIDLKISFLPLDLKKSKWKFTVEDNKIRLGFCALKNFSESAYNEIQEKCVPFEENIPLIEQIHNKVQALACNKKQVTALIFSGVFGDVKKEYDYYFNLRKEEPYDEYKFGDTKVTPLCSKRTLEYAMYDNCFTSNHEDLPKVYLETLKLYQDFSNIGYIYETKVIKDKNKNDMAFLKIETGDGIIDFVMFFTIYNKYKDLVKVNNKVIFKAQKQNNLSYKLLELSKI